MADEAGEAVDVAGDDVAAEFVAGFQRALQVDARAGLPGAERGAGERLVGDVDVEGAAAGRGYNLGGREAGAVAGDGGAERDGIGARSGSGWRSARLRARRLRRCR